jgi:hypothetical protein
MGGLQKLITFLGRLQMLITFWDRLQKLITFLVDLILARGEYRARLCIERDYLLQYTYSPCQKNYTENK